jgi:hypothetical protein
MSQFDIPEGSHDLVVGGILRWQDNQEHCTHREGALCQLCTQITDAEAKAIREHLDRLRQQSST